MILESGGLYGSSSIHFLDLATMDIFNKKDLPDKFFAEGADMITKADGTKVVH